jgi:antitoxin VapB
MAKLETRVAKLFKNGASQAVRLPVEFRFEGEDVYVSREEDSGDVVLSRRPGAKTWRDFFDLMRKIDVPSDYMSKRPMNVVPRERKLFSVKD